MSETLTHGATLARLFYEEHRAEFAAAMSAPSIDDKCFTISADAFDAWLIARGVLTAPASDFNSNTVERRGVVLLRNEARTRLNSSAIKAEDFPEYTIGPAKNQHLKVRLITLYAQEAPGEITARVRVSTRHHLRVIKNAIKLLNRSQHVRSEDRAAMVAFSRFMSPMLEAFSEGMIAAIKGADQAKHRAERKVAKRSKPSA
jgi:hypothetical protein